MDENLIYVLNFESEIYLLLFFSPSKIATFMQDILL